MRGGRKTERERERERLLRVRSIDYIHIFLYRWVIFGHVIPMHAYIGYRV